MKRKILKIFLIFILLITFETNILAYEVEGGGTGTSQGINEGPCGTGDCYTFGADFSIRVTLIDQNLQRVENTKSVDFRPFQPAQGGTPGIVDGMYDDATIQYRKSGPITRIGNLSPGIDEKGKVTGKSSVTSGFGQAAIDIGSMNIGNDEWISFLGSSRTGTMDPELNENRQYETYMGFGKSKIEDTDIGNYQKLRKMFTDYIASNRKENYVDNYGYVSFIDYFLHLSGFTDKWEASQDIETLNKIKTNGYIIIIEPTYMLGTRYNGHWHNVIGTPNQLAQFANWNAPGLHYVQRGTYGATMLGTVPNNWSILQEKGFLKNLFCNFMDTKSLFNSHDEQWTLNFCNNLFDSMASNTSNYFSSYVSTISRVAQSNSPYGMISYDLSQIINTNPIENECTFDIDTCNDNDFIFETKLLSGTTEKGLEQNPTNIFNCIYNMDKSNRQKYIYNVTSADGKELYCYDNVTYDFSNLKKLENEDIKSGTLVTVPRGELRVNRTCFSEKKFNDTDLLKQVLVNDNIGNKNYQQEFNFNFNGDNYTYRRNDTIYPIENRNYEEFESTPTKLNKNKHYTYSSSFSYYYDIAQGTDSENSRIGINNYALDRSLPNTNSMEFINNNLEGKIITLGNKEAGNYTNQFSAQLRDAYGLSTQAISQLRSQPAAITNNSTKINNSVYQTSTSVTFSINEDNNNTCEFDTTVKNDDILGEGVHFRVISLSNPFPGRDGTSRLPGSNWLNATENNVHTYIENNRNVTSEQVYQQQPLYTITLTPETMVRIREYNKTHSYSNYDLTCEKDTGRMCLSNYLRDGRQLPDVSGTCYSRDARIVIQQLRDQSNGFTKTNKYIYDYLTNCKLGNCEFDSNYDTNNDGKITEADYLNTYFYSCADKTAVSGG